MARSKLLVGVVVIAVTVGSAVAFVSRPPGPPPPRPEEADAVAEALLGDSDSDLPKLVVTSPAFEADGMLPLEFSCDGASASPPVEWSGAPEGTKAYALNLWHIPGPGGLKSYWVIYNIPAETTKIPKSSTKIGTMGVNDKKRKEYDPMCSKGPGVKKYNITVYALSEELKLSPEKADRESLLAAIKGKTLAHGTLTFKFERKGQ